MTRLAVCLTIGLAMARAEYAGAFALFITYLWHTANVIDAELSEENHE